LTVEKTKFYYRAKTVFESNDYFFKDDIPERERERESKIRFKLFFRSPKEEIDFIW
jgi:hypothetical protein